jgi:hypothetical protein
MNVFIQFIHCIVTGLAPIKLGCFLGVLLVRYHCGGWPEEVNSCVLNSYMVYL